MSHIEPGEGMGRAVKQTYSLDVYLDDLRMPPPGFTVVRTIDECVLLLEETEVVRLSLDYHLGNGHTADEIARWIVETGHWPREIYLHSSDMGARQRLYSYLSHHAPSEVLVHTGPFPGQ